MTFSNYLELELLDHVFGAASFSAPASVFFSLHTADPTDDGSGTEVSGNNYARKSETNNKTTWTVAASGALSNDIVITFATPSGPWGTVTHFGIWDASTGGNLLAHGALDASRAPDDGDTVRFSANALDITLD